MAAPFQAFAAAGHSLAETKTAYDFGLPAVPGFAGFTGGNVSKMSMMPGFAGAVPETMSTGDDNRINAAGKATNSSVAYTITVALEDTVGKTEKKLELDSLIFCTRDKRSQNTGKRGASGSATFPAMYNPMRYMCWPVLNQLLGTAEFRVNDRFGACKNSRYVAREFRFFGSISSALTEGMFTNDELNAATKVEKKVFTQDLGCVTGRPSKPGQCWWLVWMRFLWEDPIARRARSIESKVEDDRSRRARARRELEDFKAPILYVAGLLNRKAKIVGAPAKTGTHKWQGVLIVTEKNEEPHPDDYLPGAGDFIGTPKFLGTVRDVFPNQADDRTNAQNARAALYPEGDDDSWRTAYTKLPRVELQLRI